MDQVAIVDPEPSWRVAPTTIPPRPTEPAQPDAVDAAGPAATLGRATRPQVLGNRCAIPTASTALRRTPPPLITLAHTEEVPDTCDPLPDVAGFEVFPAGRF